MIWFERSTTSIAFLFIVVLLGGLILFLMLRYQFDPSLLIAPPGIIFSPTAVLLYFIPFWLVNASFLHGLFAYCFIVCTYDYLIPYCIFLGFAVCFTDAKRTSFSCSFNAVAKSTKCFVWQLSNWPKFKI